MQLYVWELLQTDRWEDRGTDGSSQWKRSYENML